MCNCTISTHTHSVCINQGIDYRHTAHIGEVLLHQPIVTPSYKVHITINHAL